MTTIADLKAFTAQVETWNQDAHAVASEIVGLTTGRTILIAAGRALGLRVPALEQMLPLAAMTEVAEDLTAGSFEEELQTEVALQAVVRRQMDDADRATLTGAGDQWP